MQLLGGLSAEDFLRDYWQQRPLLVRQAIPGFASPLSPDELAGLACEEGVSARIIREHGETGPWQVSYGPFAESVFATLPETHWTLLVSDVEKHVPALLNVIEPFRFLPDWRIDDLMISYAPEGGSVGPHIDDYDVFLLQAHGHRRWQIGGAPLQEERYLPDLELRILERFDAAEDWVLAPGDMLYLPPHCAHNGIAEDECMTYSIGFRTPSYQELAEQFLVYMQDRVCVDGMYADPDLKAQKHPSEISAAMLDQVGQAIERIQWRKRDIAAFLGSYLSEPKPHIFFDTPARALKRDKFEAAVASRGVVLDLKTQMLCHGSEVFVNGVAHHVQRDSYRALRTLADTRRLAAGTELPAEALDLLYRWYLDGYIVPVDNKRKRTS